MSTTQSDAATTALATDGPALQAPRVRRRPLAGMGRFSGLFVWGLLLLLFAAWIPDLFYNSQTLRVLVSDPAITAMLALALLLPTACGVFDLSVAGTLGLSVTVVVWMQANGAPVAVAVLTAVLAGTVIGLVNAFVVVTLKVNSFIATLGMTSVLAAGAYMVTQGQPIVEGISPGFLLVARSMPLGVPTPVLVMVGLAVVLWLVLEYTPFGRFLYAVGDNPDAARLAGVPVSRMLAVSLVVSATLAAVAGVFLAARLGSASPTLGGDYLLPAFSAVFLGATQIKTGRVNVLGTLIAIYLIATGVKGLQLAGAASYVDDLFNGLALIIAVALAGAARRN